MSDIDIHMHDLTTAAHLLITDWADTQVRGYLKWHPDIVDHRLTLLEEALAAVRKAVEAERADNRWGGPLADADADFNTEAMEYAEHSCDCEWCLCGAPAGSGEPIVLALP
ncbi:hypothetical protein [Streptomyces sp. NPDC090022]|uniref:hypothetical protein n=1 Tax=Streptomyces sp. NPDC090022 TaxID=3365920 RepID=UPI00382048E0